MNLTTWAVFGFIVIAIFAIIGNQGVNSLANINDQFAKLNCPMPLYSKVDFLNGTVIDSTLIKNSGKNFGTDYQCFFDSHTMAFGRQGVTSITASYVNYNVTTFNAFPNGWFSWAGDYFASIGYKVGATVNLVAYALTPINFSILGFSITQISTTALLAVVAIYILAYIPIGIFLYKSISPFASGGA